MPEERDSFKRIKRRLLEGSHKSSKQIIYFLCEKRIVFLISIVVNLQNRTKAFIFVLFLGESFMLSLTFRLQLWCCRYWFWYESPKHEGMSLCYHFLITNSYTLRFLYQRLISFDVFPWKGFIIEGVISVFFVVM